MLKSIINKGNYSLNIIKDENINIIYFLLIV